MKQVIKTIIKDFHDRNLPELIERDISVPLNSNKIISVIGPRRAGKTYLMYQVMSKIKDKTNIIYINFEDERLELKSKDLNLILESYFELYPNKKEKELYFFFDEIQEIIGWEKFVRRVYDTINKNVFVTGSSSKLLSKEIATSLRGRTITYEVLPFSFKEYLKFRKVDVDLNSTKGKAKIISNLKNYILKGSFPEIINMGQELREKTLRNYLEVMIYRDIVERYNITSVIPLKIFIKRLISNCSREYSINKLFNFLKSEGVKISKDSLYKFMHYCEDAYLIFSINNFSESISKQTIKKSYVIDNGLSSIVSLTLSKNKGRMLENLVFLELRRRNKELFFYKSKTECDFIVKKSDKIVEAIQVCYKMTEDNREREINGLLEVMRRFNLKKGTIITLDQEKKVEGINLVPVYKWLLK